MPKKIERGDPLGMSGFVGYVKKVKNDRGTLWTKFALALGGFRIVSKKWTDQCEDCSLKKKKSHCYSRAFFLKRKGKRADYNRSLWIGDSFSVPREPRFITSFCSQLKFFALYPNYYITARHEERRLGFTYEN